MCEPCIAPSPSVQGQRRKLWEIRPDLHCSVLGTCLSYADLLKIGRRAGFVPSETATEYDVHNYFVHRAEEPGRLARLMHKTLDTKYRAAVHASQMAQCEESLDAFWSRSVEEGDIPGPYWALLTHPLVTDPLIVRAFGDVHMLSHLTGSANQADARRLTGLEATLAETKRSLAAQTAEQRQAAERHADDVAVLERRLCEAELAAPALAAAQACCSASPFVPPESKRIKILPRRSASNPRAQQQRALWANFDGVQTHPCSGANFMTDSRTLNRLQNPSFRRPAGPFRRCLGKYFPSGRPAGRQRRAASGAA